ncbi:MAG: hypothetical protein IT330_02135 [Anaerolineae bacterium]|nr:hypothetical protein [Anaerolineae bacterium]
MTAFNLGREYDVVTCLFSSNGVGLDVTYDPDGLTGRGLFIGRRPG